ncbi:glycoside hydrolase, partial [Dichotomocladium elegans]
TSIRSLGGHHAPQWLEDAKFGIFIHWGVYSVPAWAPVGKEYAEWYWWQMNHPNDPTYAYHKDTYGENTTYDSFVRTTTLGSNLSAKAWLDLIDQARARYFVFTAKHHDGFAMWDTRVSNRSLAKLGPKRDVVHELMSLARQSYPHIKRGIYFSLPEWYHPKYNDASLGWHGPPFDPYSKNRTLAYTGDLGTVEDFVNDLQVPQALELIHTFAPDIFWCDIGGINNSTVWQTAYLEAAAASEQPIAWNDRCGSGSASDFTTVEYKTEAIPPDRFWEATRGMDPYSFGYNEATQAGQYATPAQLVHELVATISRGGNFLLNMGPDATGVVREPMASTLQAIGAWIDMNADAIFNTTIYWPTPTGAVSKEGARLYFTVAKQAVYLFVLDQPPPTLTIDVPLPVRRRVTTTV